MPEVPRAPSPVTSAGLSKEDHRMGALAKTCPARAAAPLQGAWGRFGSQAWAGGS